MWPSPPSAMITSASSGATWSYFAFSVLTAFCAVSEEAATKAIFRSVMENLAPSGLGGVYRARRGAPVASAVRSMVAISVTSRAAYPVALRSLRSRVSPERRSRSAFRPRRDALLASVPALVSEQSAGDLSAMAKDESLPDVVCCDDCSMRSSVMTCSSLSTSSTVTPPPVMGNSLSSVTNYFRSNTSGRARNLKTKPRKTDKRSITENTEPRHVLVAWRSPGPEFDGYRRRSP